MKLITIRSSHFPSDLYVAKTRLDSCEIFNTIKNENTTQVFGHMASFYAELQVREEDVEKALEILETESEG